MLHELLLVLSGSTSNIFDKHSRDEMLHMFELKGFIHPSEITLYDRILNSAFDYKDIMEFVKKYQFATLLKVHQNESNVEACCTVSTMTSSDSTDILKPGLYLQALCEAIPASCLNYCKTLIDLEKEILNNTDVSLTYMLHQVEKYNDLFLMLKSIIEEIQTLRLHGCLILERLNTNYGRTIVSLRPILLEIIKTVNAVFYKQLTCWLLYGEINDPYKEFFITFEEISINSSDSIETNISNTTLKKNKNLKPKLRTVIDYKMLPSFMYEETYTKVFFIGNTVKLFLEDPRNENESVEYFNIWKNNPENYYRSIYTLQNDVYRHIEFENAIEKVRLCVTEHLWFLAVKEGNFIHQLQLFRDFMLGGRGDLFQEFFRNANHLLSQKVEKVSLKELNYRYDTVFENLKFTDGAVDLFTLSFATSCDTDISNDFAWLQLVLNYKVMWPLHLIFKEDILYKYSLFFRYISALKYIQLKLNSLWCHHMRGKIDRNRNVLLFRNQASFLIDNLQYYIQVDVIESHFTELLEVISNTNDFEKIIKTHTAFVNTITEESFLWTEGDGDWQFKKPDYKSNPVLHTILKILRLINDFCNAALQWDVHLIDQQVGEMNDMEGKMDTLLKYLLKIFMDMQTHSSARPLIRLLNRLDFSKWFEKQKQ